MKTILTGIKPTGRAHLGNYVGAIKPAIALSEQEGVKSLYFIADYHALNAVQDPKLMKTYTYEMAATWIALGLDPDRSILYRQSDIPEITELSHILSCITPKSFMNKSHAYKSAVDKNLAAKVDVNAGVNMGLYAYPILMAADILLFGTDTVPVGRDQIQHVEMARDIAENFNRKFGETLTLPTYQVSEGTLVLPGLDGRKMSKSYNNTIAIFEEPTSLLKLIKKIKTDSKTPEDPKDPNDSTLFALFREFASEEEIKELGKRFQTGVGYGEVKQSVFQVVERRLQPAREIYLELLHNTEKIDKILQDGAIEARKIAASKLAEVKRKIGM
jgi:tryptophanyl-tRNA synthetase